MKFMKLMARYEPTNKIKSGEFVIPDPRVKPIPGLPGLELGSYQAVVQELERLKNAVQAVQAADEHRAARELHQQRIANPGIVANLTTATDHAVRLLDQTISLALTTLDSFVKLTLQPHQDAPRRLEDESELLAKQAEEVTAISEAATELADVDDWSGEAADAYHATATTQATALGELAQVMAGSSEALGQAAEANRGVLMVTEQSLRQARLQISMLETVGDWMAPYQASRAAARRLRQVAKDVEEVFETTSSGDVATALADQLDALLEEPEVLQPLQWPTGSSES